MEKGSISYSPDYKSKKPVKRGASDLIQAAQRIWDESESAKERSRLEREVIGKARSLVGVTSGIDVPSILAGELGLLEGAVRRLLEFEANQHQVKK